MNKQRYTTGWSKASYMVVQVEVNYSRMRTDGRRTNKSHCIFLTRRPQTCLHLGYEISRSECTNCKSFTNLYLRIFGNFSGVDE